MVELMLVVVPVMQTRNGSTYLKALLCSDCWQRWKRTSFSALEKAYLPDMTALRGRGRGRGLTIVEWCIYNSARQWDKVQSEA